MARPAAAALALMLAAAAPSPALEGPGRAIDGDTLMIGETRVRLWGIDAPELEQECRAGPLLGKSWPAGREAAAALRLLLARGPVACHDTGARSYRRIVATCGLAGADLGETMVRRGWAFDAPKYSRGRYAAAQDEARAAGRGIWQGPCEKPWAWRARQR